MQHAYFKLPTIFVQLQSSIIPENKSWRIGRKVCSLPNMYVCEGGVRGPKEINSPANNRGDWNWGLPQAPSSSLPVCVCVCSVTPSYLSLCNSLDCSPQASVSMEFSRQEYWSKLPFPSPGDLPNPRIEPASQVSPALTTVFFTTVPPRKPSLPHRPQHFPSSSPALLQKTIFYPSSLFLISPSWSFHSSSKSSQPAIATEAFSKKK